MHSSAAWAESPDDCVGEWAGARAGALALTYYKAGNPTLSQGGRTLQLAPGDVVIRDLRRRWVQDARDDFTLMTVKIPAGMLDDVSGDLRRLVMVPLRAGDPRASLLSGLIENLGRLAFDGIESPDRGPVENLLRSAVSIAFASRPMTGAIGDRRLPREIAIHLESRLSDPELSVLSLSRDLGLSVRSLQRRFQQAGVSPRAYILARRLEAAAARLRGVEHPGHICITDLAYSLGFNDASYFSRAFHEHYGLAPTGYARRHRAPR
jgi:AraC-like DNA-binding protein